MRGLETPVSNIRSKIMEEIARIAFESTDETDIEKKLEAIPYTISPTDEASYRESVWRERAIISERIRLILGLSLRPGDKAVHLTSGFESSNIADKYYEPPLMQVIPSACEKCEDNTYEVSNLCRGCIAHPCETVCPRNAISRVNGRAFIDQEKCIKCGRCKAICPYDAIAKKERPCSKACGIKVITTDEYGHARIDPDKCVSCGQCMVNCPFGAIADKSQIYQLIQSIKNGDTVIAAIAPAYVGQFGNDVTSNQLLCALKDIGFSEVYEVALGADIGAVAEARHYAKKVATGELPFLLTSCCPAWAALARTQFPETIDSISEELTPMVATARSIKKKIPDCRVVFIGPCAAKKLEAIRTTVRSDVDFVITFEELDAIFKAKDIDFKKYDPGRALHDATGVGRGYAVAGGVAAAIEECINEYYPGTPINIEHAEGLEECKKILMLAKAGKKNGCLIEGMGCPGGCIAGAGTRIPLKDARLAVQMEVKDSSTHLPPSDLLDIKLD